MKKLLLVLAVVAMASFLLVGCLPATDTDGDDGDGGGGVVVADIAFDKEYTDASGVTFIKCGDTITVTLPTPAPEDYIVYAAVKEEVLGCDTCPMYCGEEALTPNADRIVWKGVYNPLNALDSRQTANGKIDFCTDECEPFCVVALLKHPCCQGEEIALRVVTLDCTPPAIPTFTFDCLSCNPCETVCDPEGATFTFNSTCYDTCSGVGEWSFIVGGECDPCTLATSSGCPVGGTAACGCLPWQTDAERLAANGADKTYMIVFKIADNVGNYVTETYEITVDTDEVVLCLDEEIG